MKPTFKQRLLLGSITLALAAPSAFGVTETFNTPGTVNWVCPGGVTSVQVECRGGGGAGGAATGAGTASSNTSRNGGGGGGGAYAKKASVLVTPGQTYTITIPSAAVSGTNGTTTNGGGAVNGGAVTFVGDSGATVTAAGGSGGANAYNNTNGTTGAAGGVGATTAASVGDVGAVFAGGAGSAGNTGGTNVSGSGGGGAGDSADGGAGFTSTGSPYVGSGAGGILGGGAGGVGRTGSPVTSGNSNPGAGTIGASPGGGGGGAKSQSVTSLLGGNGGLGQILLTYTAPPPNFKANNALALNDPLSWTAGFVPVGSIAEWNNTVAGPNTTSLGGDLTFSGIKISDPGGLVTLNSPGGFTLTLGAAAVDLDLSAATQDLTINSNLALGAPNVWNVQSGRTATLGGAVSGSSTVTKQGAGTVILSGASTYTGNTTVSGGNFNITGTLTGNTTSSTLAYGGTAANTVVNVSNNLTLFTTTAATVANSNAVYNQTAGTVNLSPSAQAFLSTNGYSYFNLTGGTTKVNSGNFLLTNGASATGVAYVGGSGILDLNSTAGANGGVTFAGSGTLTVGPGGTVARTTGGGSAYYLTAFANATGVINVAGGNLDLGTGFLRMGNGPTITGINGSVNVAAGTLTLGTNFTNNASGANLYANYAGGTLKASAPLNSPFSTGGGVTTISTLFGAISNFAAVGNTSLDFTGGLTMDTNGNSVTYGNGLLGATGNGVKQTNISISGGGGSGYIGAPAVTFTGGTLATNGTPASGYALIASGAVTGIVITSPGEYTVDPTVTLTGGGGTGAGVTLSALSANPTDSGLTKINPGTLTLSGANTYTGATQVSGGALKFTTAFPSSTNVTVADAAQFGTVVAANDGQWINTGNLTLGNNGSVVVDYGSTTPSSSVAPISVTNLVPGTNQGVQIDAASYSGLVVGQSYPLITWTGTGPANAAAFTSVLTHRLLGNFSVSANTLSLTVTKNAAGTAISWNTGDGSWNTTDANWLAGDLTPTTYFDMLDSVLFDDATGATGNPTITLNSAVSPVGVTMNSANHDYTISGSGGIGGARGLTLDAANTKTLTLATANTYTGGTVINGGTLKLSGPGTLGSVSSPVAIGTGATLDLNGTNQTITIGAGSGTIANNSGSGTSVLTFNGSANLGTPLIADSTSNAGGKVGVVVTTSSQNFNVANTYSGGTTVNSGAFLYLGAAGTAAGTGPINLLASDSGLVGNGITIANDITGAGYISDNVNGAATITLTGTVNTSGIVTFRNAANVYNFAGSGISTLSGSIGTLGGTNGTSSAGSIVMSGSGTLNLSGANVYSGATTVNAGTLSLTGPRPVAAAGTFAVGSTGNSAILNISNGSYTVGNNGFIVGSGATAGSAGTVNQSGGTVTFTPNGNNGMLIGNGLATGIYNLSAGTLSSSGTVATTRGIILGVNDNTTATFNLSGTGTLTNAGGYLMIGRSDAALTVGTTNTVAYNQTGGTATTAGLTIGGKAAGTNTINATFSVTGGSFSATAFPTLSPGNNNTSTLTIGGTATVTLPAIPTARGTNSSASITFDSSPGGYLRPTATSANYMPLGAFSTANLTANGANFDTNGFDITVAQVLQNAPSQVGTLTKSGAGKLTLTGTNTYTGDTIVSGGVLAVSGNSIADGNKLVINGGKVDLTGTEKVATLFFGGIQQPAGSYTSADPSTNFTGAGTLVVGGGYDAWINSFFPGESNPLIIGRGADPDGDGFTNLQEFLFGTSPNAGNGSLVTTTTSGGNIVLRWLERDTGASYTVEQSATLASGSWTTAAQTPVLDGVQTGAPTGYKYYTVTIPIGSGKLFYRIDGVEN